MTDIFAALAAPFPRDKVSWRIGSTTADKKRGMALAYIDARDVMERLDAVCGPAGWQCRYPHAGAKTVCEIGIRVMRPAGFNHPAEVAEWIWKADGAGDSDVEAEKGALSDAFKRAAVRWGIARYLYDVPSQWVEIEGHGKSHSIPAKEIARLVRSLPGISVPARATPAPLQVAPPHPAPSPSVMTSADPVTGDIGSYKIEVIETGGHKNWMAFGAALIASINAATDNNEIDLWLRHNGADVKAMEEVAPKAHAKVRDAVIARRQAVSPEARAARAGLSEADSAALLAVLLTKLAEAGSAVALDRFAVASLDQRRSLLPGDRVVLDEAERGWREALTETEMAPA